MKYRVYDDSRSFLAEFNTIEAANQYVSNNDDLCAYINDDRVVEIKHVPTEAPAPYSPPTPSKPKLIDAAAALQKIREAQETTVNSIVEQVIENQGQADFDLQHPLVIKRLEELGFTVLTFTTTGGDIDAMSVSIQEALA